MSRSQPVRDARSRQNTVLRWVAIALVAVVAYVFATRFLPRWWSNRVAAIVDRSASTGWIFGIFIGFAFTLLPAVVLWFGFRSRSERRTWKGWIGWLAAAVVAAAPNLMTLGIVVGTSKAARQAEVTLNGDAIGFRSGSVVGVAAAIVGVLALIYLVRSRRSARTQNRRLRADVRESPTQADDTPGRSPQ